MRSRAAGLHPRWVKGEAQGRRGRIREGAQERDHLVAERPIVGVGPPGTALAGRPHEMRNQIAAVMGRIGGAPDGAVDRFVQHRRGRPGTEFLDQLTEREKVQQVRGLQQASDVQAVLAVDVTSQNDPRQRIPGITLHLRSENR